MDNDDFLDLEALFLGFPVPSLLTSLSSEALAAHGALGDFQLTSATHAGCTRKRTHDQLAYQLADLGRRAGFSGVQTDYSRIPTVSGDSSMRGDIYFPRDLSLINPNIPVVCDVRLGHPYTGRGSFRQSLLSAIARETNNKYRDLYHSRNITFVPLPISTFLGVGAEICHLLHLFATLLYWSISWRNPFGQS